VAVLADSRRDIALLPRPDANHQIVDGSEKLDLNLKSKKAVQHRTERRCQACAD
jgi:hypothetical protein